MLETMEEHPTLKGYLISENGDVWTCWKQTSDGNKFQYEIDYASPKLMRVSNHRGYNRVNLKRKSYLVHRLVAETFIPNPNNFPQVNHIDKDKTNNNVTNLEWCDSQQNNEHSKSKYYQVQNVATGQVEEVFNLSKWCRIKGLDAGNLLRAKSNHKGYTIVG